MSQRRIGIAILIISASFSLKAQRMVAGFGGPKFAVTWFNMEELNSRFNENNIEEISIPQMSWGSGGSGVIGGILLGGWSFGTEKIFEGDSVKIKMSYSGGYFQPGYILSFPKNPSIGIVLGIGSYSSTLDFTPLSLEKADFDTLFTDGGAKRVSRVMTSGLSLAIGTQINLFLKKGFFFIAPSVEGGYIFSPSKLSWKLWDGRDLSNSPEIKPTGPYLSFGLFFGAGF